MLAAYHRGHTCSKPWHFTLRFTSSHTAPPWSGLGHVLQAFRHQAHSSILLPPHPQCLAAAVQGWDIRYKQLIIKPSVGMDGFGTMTTCGAQEAADCASELLTALAEAGQGLDSAGIVVQPWMGNGAVHFSCLVVEGPGEGGVRAGGWGVGGRLWMG